MNKLHEIETRILLSIYRETEITHQLWDDREKFIKTLEHALSLQTTHPERTALTAGASYLANYTKAILVDSCDTLLALLKSMTDQRLRTAFASQWVTYELVSLSHVSDFIQSSESLELAQLSEADIEHAAQLNAQHLINRSKSHSLSIRNLTPTHLNLSKDMQEYILSWGYEEKKLDIESTLFFKREHPKKYEMLESIIMQSQKKSNLDI